jgi:ribosomal protein S18 acetylase RimI-like enzyme
MTVFDINYHKLVDSKLAMNGFKIILITEKFMRDNLTDIMSYVNEIRREFKDIYGWKEESKDYFLNPLVDKWKFSFAILDSSDNICMISINSRYIDKIHLHTVLVKNEYRKLGLSKYMLLKTAETAVDNGIYKLELFCQKNNTGALLLYLKMGFEIESIRDNNDLLLISDSVITRNKLIRI